MSLADRIASIFGRNSPLDTIVVPEDDPSPEVEAGAVFGAAIASMPVRQVVEIGTAQAVKGTSTHQFGRFPTLDRSNYVMVDIQSGPDVDVVSDLHSLPKDWTNRFDVLIANAVFEHLERPWIAAQEVARVLSPGGICHIATHQTFPLHGYPNDFFRFSTGALSTIFSDAGMEILAASYHHRTKILLPPKLLALQHLENWNREFPSYAVVRLAARKPQANNQSN